MDEHKEPIASDPGQVQSQAQGSPRLSQGRLLEVSTRSDVPAALHSPKDTNMSETLARLHQVDEKLDRLADSFSDFPSDISLEHIFATIPAIVLLKDRSNDL